MGTINPDQPHIQRRVHDIIRFVSAGRALDIGCGNGEVSILLSRRGFNCDGVDVASDVIDHLQLVHPEVSWHCGRAEELLRRLGTFDVVVMYHVLEHMPDPLKVMRLVKNAARPDGLIVVEVPNANGLQARLKGTSWDYFKPNHLNYFAPRHLLHMAESLNCEVLDMKGFQHFSYPQHVWWKDVIKGAMACIGFKDVISIFMRTASPDG